MCWKKGGHGTVDVHRALVNSCNVFYYLLGKKVGIDAITKYAKMFGVGEITGIDIPGESRGNPPSAEWKQRVHKEQWYPGDTISVAIGQGLLAVTTVQMATMISAVANGGHARPAAPAQDTDGRREAPGVAGTLALIRDALATSSRRDRDAPSSDRSTWREDGDGPGLQEIRGVDADKQPKDERDHAWFIGYAPAEKPEIAFAIVIEHGGHGGTTAAPVARKVLEVFFEERLPHKDPVPAPALQADLKTRPEARLAQTSAAR
jgi:penicillin-binding protein 2